MRKAGYDITVCKKRLRVCWKSVKQKAQEMNIAIK